MALIHCPECNHEISDTAKSCPNCGFHLAEKNYYAPDGTPLPPYKRNIPAGIAMLILFLFALPITALGFSLFVLPGILFVVGDFYILGAVCFYFSESRTSICPYCGGKINDIKNESGSSAVKCPTCKKTASIVGDRLKPIE